MSGTYRLRLAYVQDGVLDYGHGQNARKARANNKRIDRRIKRREHADVTREAVSSFYEDQRLDVHALMLGELDDEYLNGNSYLYDDHPELGDYNDYQNDYHEYDYYDPIDYDDYSYMDDFYIARREEPEDRIIKPEDCGKSLGDLLSEIQQRRNY